jgi:hypothetical protein
LGQNFFSKLGGTSCKQANDSYWKGVFGLHFALQKKMTLVQAAG